MDRLATKRLSIWLLLISWGFSASMQHPGFAMMVTSSINLMILMLLRTVSHFEGEYMAREHAHPNRHIITELVIIGAIGSAFLLGLYVLIRHVPWLWFPTSS